MNAVYVQEHRLLARRFARMIRGLPGGVLAVADLLDRHSQGEEVSREEWFGAWKQASASWSKSGLTAYAAAFSMKCNSFGAHFEQPEQAFVDACGAWSAYEAAKEF